MSITRPLLVVAFGLLMASSIAALFLARYAALTGVIGVGLGILFVPLVNMMERRWKLARGLGGLILLLGILLFAASVSLGAGWLISGQVEQLQNKGPEILQSVERQLQKWSEQIPWLKKQLEHASPRKIISNSGSWVLGGIQTGLGAFAGLIIVVALSLFTAINSRRYFEGALSFFPAHRRARVAELLRACGKALRAWFKAQLLDMTVVGAATAIGLWIIGVDYWIILGLLAGLLDIIPYVGPIVSALVATAVTLGSEPDKVPWVLGLFLLIQQLEGNILIPMIMREEADLPEVPLILLILVMSAWFGLLGALVAAPLLAVSRTVFLMTHKARMDQRTEPKDKLPASRAA